METLLVALVAKTYDWNLRYEGVIRSFFHVLRLLPITFTQHNLNRISKYQHEDQSSYGLRLGLRPC